MSYFQAVAHFASLPRWARCAVVLAGIIVSQSILYGPSLLGRKIMLPLDLLAQPGVYLPRTPEVAKIEPHDVILSDLLYVCEMQRRFIHAEIAAGRLPLWEPFQYAGSPNLWAWFSPLVVISWITASPAILAWVHLLEAIVAGVGAYLFFRRALGVSFWAAVFPAWCYPMTGFFIFWQGNTPGGPVFWLPWLMLAIDGVAKKPNATRVTRLAGATMLPLISGALDVAGQCLLTGGLFGTWRMFDEYRKNRAAITTRKAVLSLGAGWLLGFLLAAPYWLPVVEYSQSGSRIARRAAGVEERPPGSLSALPQIVLPDMNGATRTGSTWLGGGNQVESSAATYAGLIATLFLAPLAWCSRRHRSFNVCATALIVLAIAWCINLPMLVPLLRLPLLNMMSHNRLVFVASFFILCLAAIGIDVLQNGIGTRRKWFWVPAGATAALALWCVYRMQVLPEPIATQAGTAVQGGQSFGWIRTLSDVAQLQSWFVRAFGAAALLSGLAALGWVWALCGKRWTSSLMTLLGTVMLCDMVWFAYGRTAQSDPALYFPPLPLYTELAKLPPGRILGYTCLPANLAQAVGLPDVRGYDAVDPAHYINLIDLAAAPGVSRPSYALTQWFQPRIQIDLPGRLKLPPVLDLLGVRYLIFRGDPPAQVTPQLRSFDYWALVNPSALPRAFVPRRVQFQPDDALRLQALGAADFDPRAVAFSEQPIDLPADCAGEVEITSEVPTRISLFTKMKTRGLVVLADRWDKGWSAYLEGKRVPILRVNHALRGVVVPAGLGALEFRYERPSLAWGLRLSMFAVLVLGGLLIWERRRMKRNAR